MTPKNNICRRFSHDDTEIISSGIIKRKPSKRMSSIISTPNVRRFKKEGNIMINNYIVEKTLGKGKFASVKLCRD